MGRGNLTAVTSKNEESRNFFAVSDQRLEDPELMRVNFQLPPLPASQSVVSVLSVEFYPAQKSSLFSSLWIGLILFLSS